MKKLMGIGLVAVTSFAAMASAQTMQDVTIRASRNVVSKAAIPETGGFRVIDVSTSYGVRTSDLDLVSYAGVKTLEKRVNDAAMAACKDISRQYPNATPSEVECAKTATDKAMVEVQQIVAAAGKKAPVSR
jgi:UrcA family protein